MPFLPNLFMNELLFHDFVEDAWREIIFGCLELSSFTLLQRPSQMLMEIEVNFESKI